jgi:hypothetical protein
VDERKSIVNVSGACLGRDEGPIEHERAQKVPTLERDDPEDLEFLEQAFLETRRDFDVSSDCHGVGTTV